MTEHEEIVMILRRAIEHLAGKHNQKSHGNRFGSVGAVRQSVKRLGGDKAALKSLAKTARKKGLPQERRGKYRKQMDLKTPGVRLRKGIAGMQDTFEVATGSGEASAIGYFRNADFPGDKASPTRGELFSVKVPEKQRRQGLGRSLAIDALRTMANNGAKTVNISDTTPEGKKLVNALERDAIITHVRSSKSGKKEYKINKKVLQLSGIHNSRLQAS